MAFQDLQSLVCARAHIVAQLRKFKIAVSIYYLFNFQGASSLQSSPSSNSTFPPPMQDRRCRPFTSCCTCVSRLFCCALMIANHNSYFNPQFAQNTLVLFVQYVECFNSMFGFCRVLGCFQNIFKHKKEIRK